MIVKATLITETSMRLAAIALIGFLWSDPATGATRNVPAEYPTIQAALVASESGDIVLVSQGTYFENLTLGPAANGVTLISQSGPLLTVLDGGGAGSVITMMSVGSGTRVEGFTIRNGGGTFVLGAGVAVLDGSPSIIGNIITDNVGYAGSGLFVDHAAPMIVNNTIRNNSCPPGSGGGVYYDHSSTGVLEGNVIVGNSCRDFGGGVAVFMGSSPQIVSNTIVDNEAGRDGAGVFVTDFSNLSIAKNIIADHASGSGLVLQHSGSTILLSCNNLWANAPANYSGLTDPTGASGNTALDPLFCDAAALDFHINATSPCAPNQTDPTCDLVGALGVNCSPPTPAVSVTWGRVKADYRK